MTLGSYWTAPRHQTTFRLTKLKATDFANTKDTADIQQPVCGGRCGAVPIRRCSPKLASRPGVCAFATMNPANPAKPYLGLLHVLALPTGTTAGLQLRCAWHKQPR
ncbi:MAG: hypothetical protein WKG07_10725 [Hymenobacter sp.]